MVQCDKQQTPSQCGSEWTAFRGLVSASSSGHQQHLWKKIKEIKTPKKRLSGLDVESCLEAFGEHFLHFCQKHGYDKILRVLGSNLEDFLANLDNLHDHLGSTYPGMRAPSFRTSVGPDDTLLLHYYSERKGLHAIVRGLVKIVAKEFFSSEVTVRTRETGEKGQSNFVVFEIRQRSLDDSVPCHSALSRTKSVGQPSTDTQDLPIGMRTFCAAFPFHVMFRRDFTITQAGTSLLRVTRETWKTKRRVLFTDLFKICRPVIDCTFESIVYHKNTVFVVTTRDDVLFDNRPPSGLRLKGQMVWVPESDQLLFLCSPRVSGLDEMCHAGVFFSDFPVHDRGRDLVLLGYHRRGERELVEKLDEASNHLKVLDKKLRDDKKRTEELLQSIFPGHVATKLCQSLPVEAERFELVTCLFSDIVGFTALCGTATPIDIVRLLNRLYLQFDNLTSLHDVYKVETIGDAYVVVAGVPKYVSNHADRVIDMALAMVEVTRYVTSPVDGMAIEIRVGVHSGPVMAGVLGVKMPRYCLLGNTVTVANQLESKSKPGRVTISDSTKRCLSQDIYEFEENPNTVGLSVCGEFVTRIPREGDSADMAALSVSGGGGSMFRSPTNSPGHSDEATTNDSNSPSLQSPSPHLTFKGNVCIPHIEIHGHVETAGPKTDSPGFRRRNTGRVFVFPPQIDAPCIFPSVREYVDHPRSCPVVPETLKALSLTPYISSASDNLRYSPPQHPIVGNGSALHESADKVEENISKAIRPYSTHLPEDDLEPSSTPPTILQPIPSCRKRFKKMLSRKWSQHRTSPAERFIEGQQQTTSTSVKKSESKRTSFFLGRLFSFKVKKKSDPSLEEIPESVQFSNAQSKSEEPLATNVTPFENQARRDVDREQSRKQFLSRRTFGVLGRVKLSALF